jgi:RNA polymerase sigma-70 factor (ECF subfamily)
VTAGRAILRERIAEAMARLPERQRVAVMLFDGEGYSHAEIAAVLQVPEGTVRSYVFHARRALRKSLAALVEEPA